MQKNNSILQPPCAYSYEPVQNTDANLDGLNDFSPEQAIKREIKQDSLHENISATFFDADGDKYQDLIVVNGGSEHNNYFLRILLPSMEFENIHSV